MALGSPGWRRRTQHWRPPTRRFPVGVVLAGLAIGGWLGFDLPELKRTRAFLAALSDDVQVDTSREATLVSRSFARCARGNLQDCVVDGDTIRIAGTTIRLAGIDAPEVDPPRCEAEATLGYRATARLAALLDEGPFELRPIVGRDQDQYGRPLRIAVRGNIDLGDVLIGEGLARRYGGGGRDGWC